MLAGGGGGEANGTGASVLWKLSSPDLCASLNSHPAPETAPPLLLID
jgi:hypothetical protein